MDAEVILEMFAKKFGDIQLKKDIVRSFPELFYERPTELQLKALAPITDGRDTYIRCFSGFGMGKRATLAMGILQNLSFSAKNTRPGKVQAIVLTRIKSESCSFTARESTVKRAVKMQQTIMAMGKYMGVKCSLYISDSDRRRHEVAARKAHIVIASTRNVLRLFRHRIIDPCSLKMVVFDEADSLLADDVDIIACDDLRSIFAMTADNAQFVIMTSQPTNNLDAFVEQTDLSPTRIEIDFNYNAIHHYRLIVSESEKREFLRELLRRRNERKTVVFTQFAQTTEELKDEFSGSRPLFMHYDMPKSQRYEVISEFLADAERRLLFATDNLPYGSIGSGQVSLIINYDFPSRRNYAHRFVRAGFVGGDRGGDIISFTCVANLSTVKLVESFYNIKIDSFPEGPSVCAVAAN
uniref:ATP-dependent RNA helicase n=2 Tax=Parascaris univalens TaxID=6257 RepID=A0A915BTN3_PARUN